MQHPVGEAKALKERGDLGAERLPRLGPEPPGREHDIFQGRHMGKQVEGLEHDPDPLADGLRVQRRLCDILAVQPDLPIIQGFEEIYGAE